MTTGRMVVAVSVVAVTIIARNPLEQTMQRHMLMQLPMLFGAGMLFGYAAPPRKDVPAMGRGWNVQGVAGLLFASGVLATWMVPRALDAAVEHVAIDALKLLSVVAAGAIALHSWHVASTIVRTFVLGNMAWMTATIGMLLLDTLVRLCTSYGSSDQHETGIAMIALTVAGVAGAAVYALWVPRRQPA
ncbi:hypothetical protein [Gemmatimonas sp.]|uniref:hypothetical protein n=1 Tax=Gemmatimonas sp. TaxID=1962908 RepID=UPI003983345E